MPSNSSTKLSHLCYNKPVSKKAVNAVPRKEQRMELTVILQVARLIVSVISLVLSRRKPKKRKK